MAEPRHVARQRAAQEAAKASKAAAARQQPHAEQPEPELTRLKRVRPEEEGDGRGGDGRGGDTAALGADEDPYAGEQFEPLPDVSAVDEAERLGRDWEAEFAAPEAKRDRRDGVWAWLPSKEFVKTTIARIILLAVIAILVYASLPMPTMPPSPLSPPPPVG